MSNWVKIKYEPAAEAFLLDFHFETTPEWPKPGSQHLHMGLGTEALKDLKYAVDKALSQSRKESSDAG